MKKLINLFVTTLLIGTFAVGAAGCGAKSAEKTSEPEKATATVSDSQTPTTAEEFTIRVGVCSGDQNQLLGILDKHTGFVKERGINLEITEFAAGINTIDAITTGQLDVGLFADYAGVNRIGNTIADTELRAFATINKNNIDKLYVDPEVINKPEDLVGQTIISMAGVVYEYDYGKLFDTFNIDPNSVTFANVQSAQEALAVAQSKGGVSFWANAQNAAKFEEIGWKPLLELADVDAVRYNFLVSTETYLTEHKEEVAKYLTVSDEAFEYIEANKDEFFTWVEEDLGLKKDIAIKGWDSVTHNYTFKQEAYEDLVKVEKWCYQNGNFDTDYEFADYINSDALQEAFPDRVDWNKK